MLAIIMAGGDGNRWELPTPKEVAPILGEPVVRRTVRMLRERGIEPVVASHKLAVAQAVNGARMIGERRRFYLSHADNLQPKWEPRNAILLGDVAYTDQALDTILAAPAPIWWFGRCPAMFAMVWQDTPRTREVIHRTVIDAFHCKGKRQGRTIAVYWQWRDRRSGHWSQVRPDFTVIRDETGDMDYVRSWRLVAGRFERMAW